MKSLNQIPDTNKLISYERTPCFGWCPTYQVTVLKNGQVFFVGKQFVPFLDTVRLDLPKNILDQVKTMLEHPDYLNIEIKEPEYQITDIPGLNFKDYEHDRAYELDMMIPEPIRVLTERIDQVLSDKKLLYSKDKYPMIKTEILVDLSPDIDPYSLEGKDTFYQLSYRDDIGANIYKYELICAEERIQDALNAINQRQGVQESQLNHKLDRR